MARPNPSCATPCSFEATDDSKGLPQLFEDRGESGAKQKTRGAIEGAKEKITGGKSSEQEKQPAGRS